MLLNDPTKAKQTETTQRFKVRLVNQAGEELPTKVEFSRRDQKEAWLDEAINPEIARTYKRQSFLFQHYSGELAAAQKIRALAGRPETQARDVFDLYHLYLGGFWTDRVQPGSARAKSKACENAISISYDQYRDQVESYLATDSLPQFGGKKTWQSIQDFVVGRLS